MAVKRFIEVYDLECLINLFTYTGYDVTNKQWYQFVICPWRNQFSMTKALLGACCCNSEFFMI